MTSQSIEPEPPQPPQIDAIDRIIIRNLAAKGDLKLFELAELTGLSTSAVQSRLRRLEQAQVIEGYAARISYSAVKVELAAFIELTPQPPRMVGGVPEGLIDIPEIMACYSVAGDASFLLYVRVRDSVALEDLIDRIRMRTQASTRTTVVLRTFFEQRPPAI